MLYYLGTDVFNMFKREKIPLTRAGQRFCFVLLLLMVGTSLIIFYSSNLQALWSPTCSTTSSESYHSDMITTTLSNSVTDPPLSEYHVAYPRKYHFIVDEPNRCQKENPFLVLVVPVAPHNREARDIIRNTWGTETMVLGQRISHYFLLGLSAEANGTEILQKQVLQESQKHHDILQFNFLDSYKNLTIKTMIMFEWLVSHCPNTTYAMKIDSDIFLNVHNLVDILLKAPRTFYMTGIVIRDAAVHRNPTSKWYLPVSVFPKSTYPPYAMGLGYVFSLDLPQKILEASAHVKAIYIEDVYVGLCLEHLRISLTGPPRSGLFTSTVPESVSNCYWTSVITAMLKNSKQLLHEWEEYQIQRKGGCMSLRV